MAHLPSNVATYDFVPLVAFDFLEPRLAVRDTTWTLRSWAKVEEVERCLDHFEWLIHVVRQPRGCAMFIGDLATGFLLSLESAIQLLRDEADPKGSDGWLVKQSAYDCTLRALRTLRHLEAHVRPGAITNQHNRKTFTRFATGADSGETVAWFWAPIDAAEFGRLRHPKVSLSDLDQVNALLSAEPIVSLMHTATLQLVAVFKAAEP